jgi:signal transduction histidine kinase
VHTVAVTPHQRATWGRLAHALAHEVRGPLNALGLYVELLTMPREPTATESLSAKAREQVQRVDQLLGDLLVLWAPGEEGPADLSAIVEVAVRLAGRDGRHRGDRLAAEVEPGLRVALTADLVVDFVVGLVGAAAETGRPGVVRLSRAEGRVRLEVAADGVDRWGTVLGAAPDGVTVERGAGLVAATFDAG